MGSGARDEAVRERGARWAGCAAHVAPHCAPRRAAPPHFAEPRAQVGGDDELDAVRVELVEALHKWAARRVGRGERRGLLRNRVRELAHEVGGVLEELGRGLLVRPRADQLRDGRVPRRRARRARVGGRREARVEQLLLEVHRARSAEVGRVCTHTHTRFTLDGRKKVTPFWPACKGRWGQQRAAAARWPKLPTAQVANF